MEGHESQRSPPHDPASTAAHGYLLAASLSAEGNTASEALFGDRPAIEASYSPAVGRPCAALHTGSGQQRPSSPADRHQTRESAAFTIAQLTDEGHLTHCASDTNIGTGVTAAAAVAGAMW